MPTTGEPFGWAKGLGGKAIRLGAALAPETSSLSRLDRPLHLLADLYAAVAGCWLVEYAEADEVVPGIVERLGEP